MIHIYPNVYFRPHRPSPNINPPRGGPSRQPQGRAGGRGRQPESRGGRGDRGGDRGGDRAGQARRGADPRRKDKDKDKVLLYYCLQHSL